ncbi:MAG: tRNA lysidine(34) synthetase TilS [Nocardioidaceae bacterium]
MAVSGRLDPSVAAVRRAVRLGLADIDAGRRVVVACSGGSDSMALAAATAFEGVNAGWLTEAVVIDHGRQPGSADVATAVARRLETLEAFAGVGPVVVERVVVGRLGGPEAAARDARYAALDLHARRLDAVVLLGHTRDDQAETVLLGLARGSGLRSLAGMRSSSGPYRRPLLTVSRAETTQACRALDIPVWHDPDNVDTRFTRVRVRRTVLPLLEAELGPGVGHALARTADQAAADVDALDALGAELYARAATLAETGPCLDLALLVEVPTALRRRVLRLAALAAGCPGGELFAVHVEALDALCVDWHGQRGVDLPGPVTAGRRATTLCFMSG